MPFGDQELIIIQESGSEPRRWKFPAAALSRRGAGQVVPLPLKHTDVKAQLTSSSARSRSPSSTTTPYGSKIEAVYTFPLPDDAGVRDFVLQIASAASAASSASARRRSGSTSKRGARARRLAADPGPPEHLHAGVANIEPGKQIDVQITYFHTLRYQEGIFEFVFPMVVGPRYTPAATSRRFPSST
jgi:Ca-activated chloride channel family protein